MAEARILVRPDTTRFRAELEAQLAAVTKTAIRIPIVPVVAGTGLTTAVAETNALTTIQKEAVVSTQALAAAQEREAVTATEAAAAQATHAKSISQLLRGAGASGLTLFGLRGATLAASGAFLAGTAAVVGFSKAVKSAADLETQLNVFAVNAGATADQLERVSATAKQLGRDLTLPGITAADAAEAMTELAKAGLSVDNAISAARGTLQLATAAQLDNAAAAKLVSGSLNTFELAGTEAVKVADLFAGAAKSAQGSVQDFGPALAQVGAVAHGFGITIGDTVALLTQLAKAGLEGGRAGTSLRVALLRLSTPKAEETLKALNVQLRDLDGNVRPQVFAELDKALQGVSKSQRQATELTLLGTDAIRTQLILGPQGAAAFNKVRTAVNEAGLAQEQAAARTKGLTGDFQNLSNQVDGLSLTVGQLASGPTKVVVTELANVAANANTAADALIVLSGAVGTLTGKLADGIPVLGRYVKLVELAAKIQFNPKEGIGDALSGIADRAKAAAEGLKQAIAANVGGLRDTPGLKEFADNLELLIGAIEKSGPKAKKGMDALEKAVKDGSNRVGAAATFVEFPVQRIQNIVQGFDDRQVRDKIAGDNQKLVADLQAEQQFLIDELQRQGVKNRPALRRALESALLGVGNELKSIQQQAKTDNAKLANDAKQLANQQAQALLAGQSDARARQQNVIDEAAQTKPLQDDLNAQQKLKAIVLKQIAVVKERISLENGRSAALTALQAILITIDGQTNALLKQQRDARIQQAANLAANKSLDVSLAQITGNKQAEINARLKLIEDLKKEQKLTQAGTTAYKQLRNDIAEQNKAIAALQGEKKKQNSALSSAEFDFLQTQQGFASSLLGNLIPKAATTGLVGGSQAPVQVALQPVAGAAEARSQSGVTSGQGNATNHLLSRILQQLMELNGTQKAPEAKRQVVGQNSTMDGAYGV